jgi:hypothetical protein
VAVPVITSTDQQM